MKAIIGCVMTLALTLAMLHYVGGITERKTSREKYTSFFEQEEDFDVLFVGSSHVINAVFPMELWNDYGIVSFNLGGYANQLPTSYWSMMLALEHTTPRLIVIDGYYLSSNSKIFPDFSNIHYTFDAYPISINKVKAAFDLIDEQGIRDTAEGSFNEELPSYTGFLWDFYVYHSRWDDIRKRDFEPEYSKEMGAYARNNVAKPDPIVKIPAERKLEGDTTAIAYLEKIIEECQSRGIDVLLTYLPYPAPEAYQMDANRLYDIADQYQINYINFLDLDVVNYETDCADADSHLNTSGARKVTDYLGQYIVEHYQISDRRDDPGYDGWNADYAAYEKFMLDALEGQETLDSYLMMLTDKNYLSVLQIEDDEIWEDIHYVNLLENLGIEKEKISDSVGFLVAQEGQVEYLENLNSSLYVSGVEVPQAEYDAAVRIMVIDRETMEIKDFATFCLNEQGGENKNTVYKRSNPKEKAADWYS